MNILAGLSSIRGIFSMLIKRNTVLRINAMKSVIRVKNARKIVTDRATSSFLGVSLARSRLSKIRTTHAINAVDIARDTMSFDGTKMDAM